MQHSNSLREGERLFTICNACRYCEGYCAVFPAMERRLTFDKDDLEYLAHLCHNCGECLDACQYAPPHEFGVDLPKTLAEIRERSYTEHAWPARPLVAMAVVVIVAMVGAIWVTPPPSDSGLFYRAFSYEAMVAAFGILGGFAAVAMVVGAVRSLTVAVRLNGDAAKDVLGLTYLGGARRWFHHLTFYGFLLCFASTISAAFYHHVLGEPAPYPYLSVPVVLGTIGGLGLLIGPVGLFWLKRGDIALPATLFATSLTGLALLALRETAAMAPLLYVHLAVVALLFITMPYGKFVHGIYRSAALVRYAVERHAGK